MQFSCKMKFLNVVILITFAFQSITSLDVTCKFKDDMAVQLKDKYFPNIYGSDDDKPYYCKVIQVEVIEPAQFLRNINGQHLRGYAANKVEAVHISSFICQFIPIGFGKYFANLEVLHIEKSGLKSINKFDLYGMKKLNGLFLNENKLLALDADIFDFTPEIKYIDVSKNLIFHIDAVILSSIKNLKQFNFEDNACLTKEFFINDRARITYILKHCQQSSYLQYLENKKFFAVNSVYENVQKNVIQEYFRS